MRTASEMGDGVAFVDGEYVPVADAKISFFDQAVMMSDATYDVVGVCNGSFFRLEDHLERFERSMAKLRLKLPYDRAGIAGILTECVRRGGLKDAFVEMACTRGVATPGTRDLGAFTNKFVAFAVPYINLATPEIEDRGMHLFVSSVERTSPKSIDPTIKNYSRLDFITAEFETKERGADRALLLDADGHVTEGHGYNIFALCGGTLMTPAQGVLEGITRKNRARTLRGDQRQGGGRGLHGGPASGRRRSDDHQYRRRHHSGHQGRRSPDRRRPRRSLDDEAARSLLGQARRPRIRDADRLRRLSSSTRRAATRSSRSGSAALASSSGSIP